MRIDLLGVLGSGEILMPMQHGLPDEVPLERVLYEAYADEAALAGERLPFWDDVTPQEQRLWCAVAQVAYARTTGQTGR